MPKTDPLSADVQRDLVTFKRHLNPIVRTLEEAAERQQFAPPPAPPLFGDEGKRVMRSYVGLCMRPFMPGAWMEFWAANAALQSATMAHWTGTK